METKVTIFINIITSVQRSNNSNIAQMALHRVQIALFQGTKHFKVHEHSHPLLYFERAYLLQQSVYLKRIELYI